MCVCASCALPVPTEAENGLGSPGNEVLNGCELSCVHWEPNQAQEQVVLTIGASLQRLPLYPHSKFLSSAPPLFSCNKAIRELKLNASTIKFTQDG